MTTHHAPSVVYPLARSRLQGQILLAFWLTGLLTLCFWLNVNWPPDWRQLLAAVTVICTGLAGYFGWRNSVQGQLAWDGRMWRWESPGYQSGVAEQKLSVVADFQHVLLLRAENQAHATLWLWLERTAAPERWLDLRRAVYSPQKASETALPIRPRHVNETLPGP